MIKLKSIGIWVFLSVLTFSLVYGQEESESILEKYIRTGIENNLALKQRESDWKEASARLREAKGLFFPNISLNARYSVADGGRIIEFPVGDLLNPVYSTLNTLTGSDRFPSIENEEFPFLRPTEHETKLRLVQPLLNTDIIYNSRIRRNNLDIEYADMNSYRRSLVFEIKQAYYNYLQAIELLKLLNNTLPVLQENLRVNHKLLENQKVTRDVVLRSESEIRKLEENIASSEGGVEVSRAYFNFLLNKDLESGIEVSAKELPDIPVDIEPFVLAALENREEIAKLENYSLLAENNLRMNRSSGLPEINAVVDYGFQGEEYRFTSEDDFLLASVVLRWDLFKGLQERSRISQARIMEEKIDYQMEEVKNMIRLEILNAWHDLVSAQKQLVAARANAESAKEVFRMVSKKYNQNQAVYLEFLDARNNMTRADQNLIINTYDLLIKYAAFEKSAGLFEFKTE